MIDEELQNNEVVVSSRIRLARNIADFPFVSTCSDDQCAEIESTVRSGLGEDEQLNRLSFVGSRELDELERRFLLDLRMVSRSAQENSTGEILDSANSEIEAEQGDPESAIDLLSIDEASLTINEEDHLRITVTRNDLNLAAAWEQINELDDRIEQRFNYAFSPRWGYLTACPANVGTGMRVSVVVHLPALTMTGQIDKVFRSLQRINVVARGVFGETAVGDFYRISNQATLGVLESDLIEQVAGVIPEIVKYEQQAREFLIGENREGMRRESAMALEQLCKWDLDDDSPDSLEQVLALLSKVRMGVGIGLLDQNDANRVNRMFALVQLRQHLLNTVALEQYSLASRLRDQIDRLEQGDWDPGAYDQDDPHEGDPA